MMIFCLLLELLPFYLKNVLQEAVLPKIAFFYALKLKMTPTAADIAINTTGLHFSLFCAAKRMRPKRIAFQAKRSAGPPVALNFSRSSRVTATTFIPEAAISAIEAGRSP